MRKTTLLMMLGTAAAIQCAPVMAQTAPAGTSPLQTPEDVVVMRRVVAPPKVIRAIGDYKAPEGTDTSKPYWAVTPFLLGEPACTDTATATRGVACFSGSSQVDDSQCSATKPPTTEATSDYRKCDYDWVSTISGEWAESCATTTRPLTSVCTRRSTGGEVSDDFCRGDKPDSETGFNPAGCTFSWTAGDWKPWADACSDNTSRERNVSCVRSDGQSAPEASCTGTKPATTETGANRAGCTYTWNPGQWTPVTPGCGAAVPVQRTPTCVTNDGSSDESRCDPATKPATTGTGQDYSGCTFRWVEGQWGEYSSQCSVNSRRAREVNCVRSDETLADTIQCKDAKPATEETVENVSGCTFDWRYSEWTPNAGCSANTSQTRTATCTRSDSTPAEPGECSAAPDATTRTFGVYSSCTYDWAPRPYTWDSTCSNTANGTRTVDCLRRDGDNTPVAESFCDQSTKPGTTTVSVQTDGCALSWEYGEWTPWSSLCSATANRSRTASCFKAFPAPTGPMAISPNDCNNITREATSETLPNYSSCAAYWEYGPWGWNGTDGARSSACSASPEQNRTATCVKLDTTGTKQTVAASQCAAVTPETTRTTAGDFSNCTYAWSPPTGDTTTGWSASFPTCSATAGQTRTVTCLRSDGLPAANENLCTTAKPLATRTVQENSGCANLLTDGGFESTTLSTTSSGTGRWYTYVAGRASIVADARTGTKAVQVVRNPTSANIYGLVQNYTYPRQSIYNISFYCKGNANLFVEIGNPNGTGFTNRTVTCGAGWTLINLTVDYRSASFPGGNPTSGQMFLYPLSTGTTIQIDDIILYTF